MFDELFETDIDVSEPCRDQLAVDKNSGRGPGFFTPRVAVYVRTVVVVFLIPLTRNDHRRRQASAFLLTLSAFVEKIVLVIPNAGALFGVVEKWWDEKIKL